MKGLSTMDHINSISICLIGKNEEKCIENCLKALSITKLSICFTDTGSTDRTVTLASTYADSILHYDWCNDFSKARNFCASKAKTDWIWMIDCDEFLLSSDLNALYSFCSNPDNIHKIGTVLRQDKYPLNGQISKANVRIGRIYNRQYYHYTGTIHEQLTPIRHVENLYYDLPITFDHAGYEFPALLREKCNRNILLLKQSLADQDDPYIYYQLGKAYSALQDYGTAYEYFNKGLAFDLDPKLEYVQSMVESYGYCLLELKHYAEALNFEGIYDTFATNADFHFLMGLIYMNNTRFNDAIAQFKKATDYQCCVVEGTNSYLAFYNIGVIYECLGYQENAILYYKKCRDFKPAFERLEVLLHG